MNFSQNSSRRTAIVFQGTRKLLVALTLIAFDICLTSQLCFGAGYAKKWAAILPQSSTNYITWIQGFANANCTPGNDILVSQENDASHISDLYLVDGASGLIEGHFIENYFYDPSNREGLVGTNMSQTALLTDVDGDGRSELVVLKADSLICYQSDCSPVGVRESGEINPIPASLQLGQNYPNPFNPATAIAYTVRKTSHITLTIYNVLGQAVRVLVDANQKPGTYTVQWDGMDTHDRVLSSGVYFYALQTETDKESRKMLYLK